MIDDLERQGLIRKLPVDRKKVDDALAHARRDLATAGTILANDQDWAYTIAYNAVLQAGRALMFSKGYRPDGANQHVAVVKFAELFLDQPTPSLLTGCGASETVPSTTQQVRSRIVKQRMH